MVATEQHFMPHSGYANIVLSYRQVLRLTICKTNYVVTDISIRDRCLFMPLFIYKNYEYIQ